eukprot:GHVL01009304.1.p1 GENE.GHVL01009304.1~~GHVL01009304.1.p1  ORF type:complete len:394 (+),score=72.22 GHVL01009304.1:93-1184(+)
MEKDDITLKGVASWSINWDNGMTYDYIKYNWKFAHYFKDFFFGESSTFTPVPDRIISGYWHNFATGTGPQGGVAGDDDLTNIDSAYNVVMIGFMTPSVNGLPTFMPYNVSEKDLITKIQILKSRGVVVLLSISSLYDYNVDMGNIKEISDKFIRLVYLYGFDGIDLNLVRCDWSANITGDAIIDSLKVAIDHYRQNGLKLILSVTTTSSCLVGNSDRNVVRYIDALDELCDFIQVYYYALNLYGIGNGQGPAPENITDDNHASTYTKHLIYGYNGYRKVHSQKLVIGLPANPDAADENYVERLHSFKEAFQNMEKDDITLKGVASWSINWDNGMTYDYIKYNWKFAHYFKDFFFGESSTDRII